MFDNSEIQSIEYAFSICFVFFGSMSPTSHMRIELYVAGVYVCLHLGKDLVEKY